jgi:hypothetical protein
MKNRFYVLVLSILSIFLIWNCSEQPPTQSIEESTSQIQLNASVEPVLFDLWPPEGEQGQDAISECGYAGGCGDFAWKVDASAPDGDYDTSTDQYGNAPVVSGPTITISNSDGQTFDWSISAGYEVCAVIVKASTKALVYYYPEGATGDTDLHSVIKQLVPLQYFDISHVTFCFNEADVGDCYQEETAWADGNRYTQRGNWATYTPYPGDGTSVNIYAGKTTLVGTAMFADNGDGTVTITINLIGGTIFYYDLNDLVADENLKVQDYDTAPSGNPAPGTFDGKATFDVGSTSGSITVPLNNFYGIHLDIAVVCDAVEPCDEWIVYGSNLNAGADELDDAIYAYDLNAQTQTLVYDPTPIDGSQNYPNANAYDPEKQRIYFGTDDGRLFYHEIGSGIHVQVHGGATSGSFGTMHNAAWYNGKLYYIAGSGPTLYEVTISDDMATRSPIGSVPRTGGYGDIVFDPANPGRFVAVCSSGWYWYDITDNSSGLLTHQGDGDATLRQLAYGSDGVLYAVKATTGEFYTVEYDIVSETVTHTFYWDSEYTYTDLASGPQCSE